MLKILCWSESQDQDHDLIKLCVCVCVIRFTIVKDNMIVIDYIFNQEMENGLNNKHKQKKNKQKNLVAI